MATERELDDLEDLAAAVHGKALRELRVAFPAEVMRYDASKQVVDVRPYVADFFPSSTGDPDDVEQVFLPVIPNVPVAFPGAGGFRVTFPIAVGDTVEVLIQDRSIDAWQKQGGRQAPDDQRRHALADAVAIPGLHDDTKAWSGASTSDMTLGKDGGNLITLKASGEIDLGGADDAVAKAAAVLSALNTALAAGISGAVAGDGGHAALAAVQSSLTGASIGSSVVKVKS